MYLCTTSNSGSNTYSEDNSDSPEEESDEDDQGIVSVGDKFIYTAVVMMRRVTKQWLYNVSFVVVSCT